MSQETQDMDEKEDFSTSITISDPIIEPFYVIKDRYCYTLHFKTKTNPKYTVDGTSKEVIKTVGHFKDLASCLVRIAREKVHFKKEYTSIKDYINEYNKISTEAKTFLNQYINEPD